MLFQLPSDLQLHLIEQWFDLWMIIAADTSLCNRHVRSEWRMLWSNGLTLSCENFGKIRHPNILKWVIYQEIIAEHLDLSHFGETHNKQLASYLVNMKSHVKKLELTAHRALILNALSTTELFGNLEEITLREISDLSQEFILKLNLSTTSVHLNAFEGDNEAPVFMFGPQLRSVWVTWKWTSEIVLQLAQSCHNLEEINFGQNDFGNQDFDAQSLVTLLNNNSQVKRVHVNQEWRLGHQHAFAAHVSPSLTSLHLHIGLRSVFDDCLLPLVRRCHQLRDLEFYTDGHEMDVSEKIQAVCRASPQLTRLKVNCARVEICDILSVCPSLTALEGHCNMTKPIATDFNHQLKVLDLEIYNDAWNRQHFASLCAHFRHSLKAIQLTSYMGALKLDDMMNAIAAPPRGVGDSAYFPLRVLKLHRARFQLESLAAFLPVCPFITHLTLAECNIDIATLKLIGDHATNLQYLDVSGNIRVDDAGIRYVLKKCRCLSHPLRGASVILDEKAHISEALKGMLFQRDILRRSYERIAEDISL